MRRILAVPALLALLLAGCGAQQDPLPETEQTQEPAEDLGADQDVLEPDEDAGPADESASTDGATDTAGDTTTDDTATTGTDVDAGAQPDPDQLAAPCDGHEDRSDEAFIELVAPVDEQVAADGSLELVGCSNVYEATVSWRMLDGDGRTLDEGFTTAECGSGCVGAFRETLELSAAAGEPVVYLQVFWEDAQDGSDRDLVERIVVVS